MKRSAKVGLIIMGGALGVGSLAYLASPSDRCRTEPGYEALHASECAARSSGSGSGGHGGSSGSGGSRYSSFSSGDDSASRGGSAGSGTATTAGGVQRGGFGSLWSSLGSHFSGGG